MSAPLWPIGTGEMAERVRRFDWAATSLGPIAEWCANLRSTVDTMINSPIPKVLMWGDDHIMVYNDGYVAIAGAYHPRALGGTVPGIWPEIWHWNRKILEQGMAGKALSYSDVSLVLNRYGRPEEVTFDLFYTPIHLDDGRVGGVMCTVLETTARVAAERAVHDSNERFRRAIDAVQGVLWTNDAQGRMAGEQPGWAALTGQDFAQYQGYGWADAVHPDDVPATIAAWERAVATRSVFIHEHRVRRHDGAWRSFTIRAVPVLDTAGEVQEWVGVHTDITEQRAAEAQLRSLNETLECRVNAEIEARRKAEAALTQAQKLETIGKMTGGVAHDFNNLLQVISGNLHLLARDTAGDPRAATRVTNALAGVERGARLAAQLLAFGRRQALEPRVVNVARLVRAMDDLLRRTIGEAIEVTIRAGDPVLWNCFIDPSRIENALLNLVINARDAMEGSGRLTIEMANATLSEDQARSEPELAPGDYVMLSVSDTGCGMSAATLARAYEPFFSTKPEGKGSGLGLSMVYGFVKQSGGHVKIQSEPGSGTVVRLYLPRALADEDSPCPGHSAEPAGTLGGAETVLVVEDDERVRDTVVELLQDLGYRVLQAADAQAGLDIIAAGTPVDLIFTDVVMPGKLKSPELVARARRILPGVAVLYTSGYDESAIVHGGRLDDGVELLAKPYGREDLARKIRRVLAAAADPAPQHAETTAPAASGAPDAIAVPGPAAPAPVSILLVEDEFLIRLDTAEMLRGFGYRVLEAGTARQALQMFEAEPTDMLLTDQGLPDRSGQELAAELRARHPDLAVAYATGDAAIGGERSVTLVKPYGEAEVAQAVQAALALVRGGVAV